MKLTTERLKRLIREEINKIEESGFLEERSGMSTADKAQQLEQELMKAMIDSGKADETRAKREIKGLKDRVEMNGADSQSVTVQYQHMKALYSLDGALLRDYISYL